MDHDASCISDLRGYVHSQAKSPSSPLTIFVASNCTVHPIELPLVGSELQTISWGEDHRDQVGVLTSLLMTPSRHRVWSLALAVMNCHTSGLSHGRTIMCIEGPLPVAGSLKLVSLTVSRHGSVHSSCSQKGQG